MEASRKHALDGLKIILLNVDGAGGDSAAATALERTEECRKKFGLDFPITIHNGPFDPLARQLGSSAEGPPITAVFKDGKLLRSASGAFEPGGLEKLLEELKLFAR
ncbi:MAG: hypothetical protein HY717_05755 [Planctomycetes bacterium]|nr:hypothetical protein [Planctomycetota bacterium]